MAVKIENITNDAHQRHIVLLEDKEVTLVIRFLSIAQAWFIDVAYEGRTASGFKLALNTLHMQSQNFPFDFIVQDLTGRGVDPFRLDDFSDDRVAFYMLQRDDMAEIRGQDVPI